MTTDKQRIHSWLLIKKELWWIYVIVLSRTSFRVNPPSIVCLNGKELLSQNRRLIWSLSNSNEIWTHNHLVRERKLNHLAKLALTGWVLVYKLNDCRFESRCCHLNSDECLKMFRRKVSQWFCKFKFCEIFLNIFEDGNGSEFTIVPGLTSPDKSSFNRVKKCKNNDL